MRGRPSAQPAFTSVSATVVVSQTPHLPHPAVGGRHKASRAAEATAAGAIGVAEATQLPLASCVGCFSKESAPMGMTVSFPMLKVRPGNRPEAKAKEKGEREQHPLPLGPQEVEEWCVRIGLPDTASLIKSAKQGTIKMQHPENGRVGNRREVVANGRSVPSEAHKSHGCLRKALGASVPDRQIQ